MKRDLLGYTLKFCNGFINQWQVTGSAVLLTYSIYQLQSVIQSSSVFVTINADANIGSHSPMSMSSHVQHCTHWFSSAGMVE